MSEDLHEAHKQQQRKAFAEEIASYRNPPEIVDEQNMFRVDSGGSSSVHRTKVRMLRLSDTTRSDRTIGIKAKLYGEQAYQPGQKLEEFLEKDEPDFEDSDRLSDSSDFNLSLQKNGDFRVSLPSINGEIEGGTSIMKDYYLLSARIPFGFDLSLSFVYDFKNLSNASMKSLTVRAETPWAQKQTGKASGRSLNVNFDKETKKAVLDRISEFDFEEPETVFEEGREYELDHYGRKIKINVDSTSVRLVSSAPGNEDSEVQVSIPRTQPLEKVLDHNTEYVQRFTWEDTLIPEPIKRDPMQPYSALDEAWIRADIPTLLGVKVQKNNPPPASKMDSNS